MTEAQKTIACKHGTPDQFRHALLNAVTAGSITTEEMAHAYAKYILEWEACGEEQSDHQQRVNHFMRLAKQDVPSAPTIPSPEVRALRARLILEEALETIDALGCTVTANVAGMEMGEMIYEKITAKGLKAGHVVIKAEHDPDLTEIVDGCCDVMVVTTGTLSACGVNDAQPQRMVDENNLAKFGPGHTIREDGKLIKPPGHKAPDLAGEILRQVEEQAIVVKLAYGEPAGEPKPIKTDGKPVCELCGCPMPPGEEMFKFHGYSGPCPTKAQPQPAKRCDPCEPEKQPWGSCHGCQNLKRK